LVIMGEIKKILSIVSTSYILQRLEDICLLLQSIKAQHYSQIETIFVADQSPELALKVEEYASLISLPIRVLLNQGEAGVNICRNMGIVAAKGEIVGLVDDDIVLFPSWAEEMMRSYWRDPEVVGVTGPALPLWEDKAKSWFPKEFWWMWGVTGWDWNEIREIRNVGGMNCSFKRGVLLKAGLYQPNLGPKGGEERIEWFRPSGEEVELSLRIRKYMPAAKIIYNPKVKVYHKVQKSRCTWSFVVKRAFRFGYTKHYVESLFNEDFKSKPILNLERERLRHILLKMPPALAREFLRTPYNAWRKFTFALIGTISTGLGYVAFFIRPTREGKIGKT
jgi:glycosyltransferase involved in cell wall biosynthesis